MNRYVRKVLGIRTAWRCAVLLAACLAAFGPARPAAAAAPVAGPVWLPQLIGNADDPCEPVVHVQNPGALPVRALLVTWSEDDRGLGPCQAPAAVYCTGLLGPGASWRFGGAHWIGQPEPSHGAAIAFGVGPSAAQGNTVGDAICRAALALSGDCGAWMQLLAASRAGGAFAGVVIAPDDARPVLASVQLGCPSPGLPGRSSHAALDALPDEPEARAWHASLPWAIPARAQRAGTLLLQNAGTTAVTALVFTEAEDECGTRSACGEPLAIPPGASARLEIAGCLADPWRGHLRVEADGPLAIAVAAWDQHGVSLVAHGAEPERGGAAGGMLASALVYAPWQGWDAGIVVHNHEDAEASVQATFLDASGAVIAERAAIVCAGGSRTLALPSTAYATGRDVGTVRVLGRVRAGGGDRPARISGVAVLERWKDAERTERLEAQSVPLADIGDTVPVLASPGLAKDIGQQSRWDDMIGTELALASHATAPGWTEVAIVAFDQNAILDVLCRRLDTNATEYVDPWTLNRLDHGLRGSAVISAVAWSHADGSGPRLGGVVVSRRGTRFGEDVLGDEAGATALMPVAPPPADVGAFAMGCMPGGAPVAPPLVTRPPADAAARAARVAVPVLANFSAPEAADCTGRIEARNEAAGAAIMLFVGHGQQGPCEPECAGPVSVECSGLIAPGATWAWSAPPGLRSAIVFALGDATLGSLGLPGQGMAADALCAALETAIDRCDLYAGFLAAWDSGASYAGLPLDRLRGGRVTAMVERTCLSPIAPNGAPVILRYTSAPESVAVEDDGAFRLVTPTVFADHARHNSLLHIQNLGPRCTDVTISFRGTADCLRRLDVHILAVAPGESVGYRASNRVGPEFRGTAVIRAREPLAVVVDMFEGVTSPGGWSNNHASMAFPGRELFDVNADGRVDHLDVDAVQAAVGRVRGDAEWNERLDVLADGLIDDADVNAVRWHRCARAETPPMLEPPAETPRSADRLFVPALGNDGQGGDCGANIWVQNLGDRPARLLVLGWWRLPGTEPPDACAGPMSVSCTGLVAPGGTWHTEIFFAFDLPDPSQLPTASVWAIADVSASEAGVVLPGDPSLADVLCQALTSIKLATCDQYASLVSAWERGATWQDVPLGAVRGGALTASVTRVCPGDIQPSVGATSSYTAPGLHDFGARDETGRYTYFAPVVYADAAGYSTLIHVQNAGDAPAEVAWETTAQDDCSNWLACPATTIEPGQSITLHTSDCMGPDFQGSVRMVAGQPLAIVVEILGRDTRIAYPAVPSRRDADAAGTALVPGNSAVAYAPWSPQPEDGWDTGVNVINLDPVRTAFVKVSMIDERGAVAWVQDDRVCPAGTQTFFVPVLQGTSDRTASGTVVVESIPGPRDGLLPPPAIEGTLVAVRHVDAARTHSISMAAELLVPAPLGFLWPDGQGAEGTGAGTAIVALPGVGGRHGFGVAQTIAVANLVRLPGTTDVSVQVLDDQGARVAETCLRLAGGRSALVDIDAMGLSEDFIGSAVVSAAAWSHAAADGRRVVGLAASALHQTGEGGLGDPLGLAAGEPLRTAPGWLRAPSDPCPPAGGWPTATPTPERVGTATRTPTRASTATPTGASPTGVAPTGTPPTMDGRVYLPWAGAGR